MRQKYAVFTMDVESFTDTECVANSCENITADLMDGFDEYMDLLDKYGIKSTLFTVGNLAPKIIDRLKRSIGKGHKLALHNYEHIAPMAVSVDTFREETLKSKNMLESLFNTKIVGFRAPFFSLDDSRLNVLKQLGFKYDSSHLGFSLARHTVKLELKNFKKLSKGIFHDGNFFEFGMSNHKIFGRSYPISGGGYVRLFNWGFIKSVIQQYISGNDYYVFYLHPFELTTEKIPHIKDLKSYDKYYLQCGVKSYKKHIEQLILLLKRHGYTFVTFEELHDTLVKKVEA